MNTPSPHMIVMGASAGALDALKTVLSQLPEAFPAPIAVVVHLPPDRDSMLVEVLRHSCHMRVREAEDKERLQDGCVYIAPPNYHLLLETDGTISLSNDEAVQFSRPSIDVLFESAAYAYEDRLTGVILTGANDDGAKGLAAIAANGGHALVQNPKEAQAQAMPLAALKACPEAKKMSLEDIGKKLLETVT